MVGDSIEDQLLTRLVTLNHERAEEEKRGLIRWLRPKYQTEGLPSEALAKDGPNAQQTELEGVASTAQPHSTSSGQAPTKQQRTKNQEQRTAIPWPKELANQIRAVRTVLETLPTPANPTTIAKHFKGARKDRIEAILESIQALGHAHEVEEGKWVA